MGVHAYFIVVILTNDEKLIWKLTIEQTSISKYYKNDYSNSNENNQNSPFFGDNIYIGISNA